MGDDFFKNFFLMVFGLILFVGLIMFLQMEKKTDDTRQINSYLQSKGKAPIPDSWSKEMGSGI